MNIYHPCCQLHCQSAGFYGVIHCKNACKMPEWATFLRFYTCYCSGYFLCLLHIHRGLVIIIVKFSILSNCLGPCSLPDIPKASVYSDLVDYVQSGTSVEIKCEENYVLKGHINLNCENGQWDDLPQCLSKYHKCLL